MKPFHVIAFAAGLTLIFFAFDPARAQSPTPTYIPVALAPLMRDTPVELVALTFDADLREINGRTIISGTSTFKLHNTERLKDLELPVGFPNWAGDPFTFDPAKLDSFVISIEGKKTILTPARADLKIGNVVRAVDWYTFTLAIAGDERKILRYDFQQDLGDGLMPRITYGLVTSTGWKGKISSARVSVHFPETTTLEQIITSDPPNSTFDGTNLTWLFQNYEPPLNPSVTFLRPSVWSDLNAKRHAARQNPNDANARAAYGNLFRQLAQVESLRSDSFFSQAVAELETAVRIDGNHRVARQSLGSLYESRAGAPAGPRKPAYVFLAAAQWEALASSDASVRRQLAEDYFYLGLDAQARGAFDDAAAFYDKAFTAAPNGAGPFFTLERAAVQRRTLNTAWARSLLEKNNYATASGRARTVLGDAFMNTIKPPPFYVADVQVATKSGSRSMTLMLTPFGSTREELQNTLNDLAKSLRAINSETAVSSEGSNLALTMIVPFDNSRDLANRLAAIANVFGDRVEWSLARLISSPQGISWEEDEDVAAHITRYREQVDLAPACNAFSAQLNSLAPLENVAGNDEESQLKRALIKNAQLGWQRALALGRVVYRAGADSAVVEPCSARTVTSSVSAYHSDQIAASVGGVIVLIAGIVFVSWLVKRRKN